MCEIRKGLEQGLDISLYAKPEYTISQMEEIRNELEKEQEEEIEL